MKNFQKTKQLLLLFLFSGVFAATATHAQTANASAGIPWGWYVSRSAGLLGFLMLYISIFLGLTIRIPWLRKYFAPVFSLDAHAWISVQAILLALVHGSALLFDKFLKFSLVDVFVPFASKYETNLVAMGQIAFYLMLLLIVTSYARKYFSQTVWRSIHSLNLGLYIVSIVHALYLGTDLQSGPLRAIFIWANALLMILFVYNIYVRISFARQIKQRQSQIADINKEV